MLLAVLMPVVGLLGGLLGGPDVLLPDTERIMRGAGPRLSFEGGFTNTGRLNGGGPDEGGGTLKRPDGGGMKDDGGGVDVPARDFGGGGVADLRSTFSAPAFLLTHRLRSGS